MTASARRYPTVARTLLVVLLACCTWTAGMTASYAGQGDDLPDIGTPADAVLTQSDEYRVGAMIVRGLRDSGQILEDPELTEYIQSLGARLAMHTPEGGSRFQFFVVKDRDINAFALPGGFIGVNAGLIMATSSEAELAGVLAHEIAHVTQRHIARSIQAQGRSSLVSTAAMLAALLIGATTGMSPDMMQGAIVLAQGTAIQQRINFTRENESEADRVGIATLAAAGFDAHAMASFFETLGRGGGNPNNMKILEFLQTHPVTSARVAEAKERASQLPSTRSVDSVSYGLSRERLRVMTLPSDADPRELYKDAAGVDTQVADYRYYGRALALINANAAGEAVPILQDLVTRHQDVIQYRTALGQAQLVAGDQAASLQTFEQARGLFPRNVPVTVRYAETLMRTGDPKKAHAVLLDVFNVVPPTPDQVRLLALAANSAGDTAEAYYYLGEYNIMNGDLPQAINQLQLALATPTITPVQRSRFKARRDELKEYLPPKTQMIVDRGEPLPVPDPRSDPDQSSGRRSR